MSRFSSDKTCAQQHEPAGWHLQCVVLESARGVDCVLVHFSEAVLVNLWFEDIVIGSF